MAGIVVKKSQAGEADLPGSVPLVVCMGAGTQDRVARETFGAPCPGMARHMVSTVAQEAPARAGDLVSQAGRRTPPIQAPLAQDRAAQPTNAPFFLDTLHADALPSPLHAATPALDHAAGSASAPSDFGATPAPDRAAASHSAPSDPGATPHAARLASPLTAPLLDKGPRAGVLTTKLRRAARLVALAALLATPATADVAEAVSEVITPAYADLADRAAALAKTAATDCADTPALQADFASVWDAWARIDFLRIGPVETDGRGLAMAFWPDPKSSGLRAQQALLNDGAALADRPDDFAKLSVAARGLSGLERLLYPSTLTGDPDAICRLTRATAADLARMAAGIAADWPAYAATLTQPGGDNTLYLTQTEARQALYTQLVTGLGTLETTRLGRPLGTFDKPRPERAEAVASSRALANIVQSLTGMRDLALALDPNAAQTRAAFDHALTLANGLDDPALAGVADPQGRLKIEILQQAVAATHQAVENEIGPALGVSTGFNAKDGD